MAGLISPKPLSYMHQMQYNPYGRAVAGYSDSPANGLPPLTHPTPQSMVPGFNGTSPGIMGVHEETKIYGLVIELLDANTRETALLELSKKREQYDDLALVLWHSFGALLACGRLAPRCCKLTPCSVWYKGIMPALLQEIVSVYPLLYPPNLTAHVSNRVCNALALLQCVASHSETRQLFLNGQSPMLPPYLTDRCPTRSAAHIPLFLYPFLNTISKTRPFEYLRLTSLGVIGALVKVRHLPMFFQ